MLDARHPEHLIVPDGVLFAILRDWYYSHTHVEEHKNLGGGIVAVIGLLPPLLLFSAVFVFGVQLFSELTWVITFVFIPGLGTAIESVVNVSTSFYYLRVVGNAEITIYKMPLQGKLGFMMFFFLILGTTIFFAVLNPDLGCRSPAGYAASISRIAGSLLPQGYVYLCVAITTMSMVFLNGLQALTSKREAVLRAGTAAHNVPWLSQAVTERVWRSGFHLLLLSAILPDMADNCTLSAGQFWCWQAWVHKLHAVGIAGGILMTSLSAVLRMRCALGIVPAKDQADLKGRHPLGRVTFHALCMAIFLAIFLFVPGVNKEVPKEHLCLLHTTKEACDGGFLRSHARDAIAPGAIDAWPCVWDANAPLESIACTDPQCTAWLRPNQLRITCEYLSLFHWMLLMTWALSITEDIELDQHYGDLLVEPEASSHKAEVRGAFRWLGPRLKDAAPQG